MLLPDITLALFSLFNILRLGSYFPQIIRVAADDEGAKAISYSTWCIWIGANASTAIYAVVNVLDAALFYVSALNTVGCAAVVGLTAFKRHHFRQSHQHCARRILATAEQQARSEKDFGCASEKRSAGKNGRGFSDRWHRHHHHDPEKPCL
jgi:hypothetical protein